MKIAFPGGDERTLIAAERFAQEGAECVLTGFDEINRPENAALTFTETTGECVKGADAALLPFPSFREGFLNAPMTAKRIPEAEIMNACEGIVTLGTDDYSKDGIFLAENALLTAEAALAILISNTGVSVSGSRFVVAGYGRIGKALTRMITRLNGKATVAARSGEQRIAALSSGAEAAGFDGIEAPLTRADAVINTVPQRVFGKRELCAVRKGVPFIELASRPGGADGGEVVAAGLKYLPSPGLPGKYSPVSAGEALFRCAKRILLERGSL
ncbi:MAG: hypothetical protein J5793_04700 [Clostridia bacterium]|nr:hypothetical protein [Clostridia bacterium]